MNISPVPHVARPTPVEPVTVPMTTTALHGAGELDAAAALAARPDAAAATAVDLSALGRVVAALSAFGDPVLQLAPQPPGTPAQPGQAQPHPGGEAQHLAQALAAALRLSPATGPGPEQPPAPATTGTATALAAGTALLEHAAPGETAVPAPAPSPAGALLNTLLSAALTGQAGLELRRDAQHPPLQLVLQREADGRGGFRISRVRIRHATAEGVLEAAVQLEGGAQPGSAGAPMSVDIACDGLLATSVAGRLDELKEAFAARGLAAAVRTRSAAPAEPATPQLPPPGG